MHRSRARQLVNLLGLLVALVVVFGSGATFPQTALGATRPTIYVDGKTGSDDGHDGHSPQTAFATVKRGLWEIRYGGRLEVKGYDDYVYHETLTESQWFINGTASTPIVIEAAGYGTGDYVRPIISGAKVVSRPGEQRWTQPDRARYPDVWATPWTSSISGYESSVRGLLQERVFVDTAQPLRRPKDVPTLAELQAAPGSQYWNGKTLYVRLGGWGAPAGASTSLDPNDHLVEIPHYKGLLVASGSAYVAIRGFRIRHTTMGVGFTGSSTHGTAQDIDASYNNPMGFFTASTYHTFLRVSGTRNTIQLVKLDNGAQHNLVDGAYASENLGQGIKLTGSKCRYNTVRNSVFEGGRNVPTSAGQYGGQVQGIDIEQGASHNVITRNTVREMRRGLMLYQVNAAGSPLEGNEITFNRFHRNDTAVLIWDGKYAAEDSTGSVRFYRNTYTDNTHAVTTESTTRGKLFDNETIYRTGTTRTLGHSAFYIKAGSVTVRDSIIRGGTGYVFYAKSGARVNVSYSSLSGSLGLRNSTSRVRFGGGVVRRSPGFLSTDASSPDFLYLGPGSEGYRLNSAEGPLGARWR